MAATVITPMTSPGVGASTQRLGRYHLAEPLGGGPTGEVFRASIYGVAGLDRQFAVKRFHPGFVKDPGTAAAVSAAARTYGSLEHPRIARLQEYGVTGGFTFTATDLVEGIDLAALLVAARSAGKPLPAGAAAALISQVARTVGYAHGRGVNHLGLCPTNLIVTAEGDAKITDFGFLPPRLPRHPGNDPSLRARMPYLSPEQVLGEATSAATDVFLLGVIACELFAGKPAFQGVTSEEIARNVLATPPLLPSLPKPVFKVLQRCVARSPFERYPDARALADAMDAAIRSAPLPGGAQDVGIAASAAMERLQGVGGDQISGAVSFPMPAPPPGEARLVVARKDDDDAREPQTTLRVPHLTPGRSLTDEPDADQAIPEPVGDPAEDRTNPVRLPTSPPVALGPMKHTVRGVGKKPPQPLRMPPLAEPVEEHEEDMPTRIRERDKGFVSVPKSPRRGTVPPFATAAGGRRPGSEAGGARLPSATPLPLPEAPASGSPAPVSGEPGSLELGEGDLSGLELPIGTADGDDSAPIFVLDGGDDDDALGGDATLVPAHDPTAGAEPSLQEEALFEPSGTASSEPSGESPAAPSAEPSPANPPVPSTESSPASPPQSAIASPIPRPQFRKGSQAEARPGATPEVLEAASWVPLTPVPRDEIPVPLRDSRSQGHRRPASTMAARSVSKKSGRVWKWLLVLLLIGGLGAGGYIFYGQHFAAKLASWYRGDSPNPERDPAAEPIDSGVADDAARSADAGVARPVDAGAGPAPGVPDAGGDDSPRVPEGTKLVIRSEPGRAKVYLDGSPLGKTPVTLDATADSHRLAVVLPGYKLHTADIDGRGVIEVALEAIAPPEGPAGIKVRCSKKNRYYVFVDGVPTGQLCPSERIGVEVGTHTVEIYDPVTDSRREFPVSVKGTRHSARVRVD